MLHLAIEGTFDSDETFINQGITPLRRVRRSIASAMPAEQIHNALYRASDTRCDADEYADVCPAGCTEHTFHQQTAAGRVPLAV